MSEYGRTDTLEHELKILRQQNVNLKNKVAFWEAKCILLGTPTKKYNDKMHEIRALAKNPKDECTLKLNKIVETTFK